MRILFLGRHFTYFRNFESVIRALASRGHAVHLAVERDETLGGRALVDALVAEHPQVTCGEAPQRSDDEWAWIATRLRLGLDYLRYQHPLFDDAPILRERSRARTPQAFVGLGDAVRRHARWSRGAVSAAVRRLERAVPVDPAVRGFIEAQRPDLVLITPLVDLGSSQIDYLRAARALRVPTALCVWSWDHLSSKALIREWPDRVFVWNETQQREAMQLHGVPASRIVVTGAQCFDQWFGRAPGRSREEFCRAAGLRGDAPFLLYVCSALFHGSPVEAEFVREWVARLRGSNSPRLRSAPVLVRPHPSRVHEWNGVDLSAFGDVSVWGANPVDARSRADYFDSLYYSAAVCGLNTSAFIEAGIVGRPVHAILVPRYHDNQMGTVHFRYLVHAGGGLLNLASDFDDHLQQLDAALATPATEVKPFVREFVRPHGLDVPATDVFVRNVEAMQGLAVKAPRHGIVDAASRRIVQRLARLRDSVEWESWTCSAREQHALERLRSARADKARRSAETGQARRAEALVRREQREQEKHRRQQAKLAQRAERLRQKAAVREQKAHARAGAGVERQS